MQEYGNGTVIKADNKFRAYYSINGKRISKRFNTRPEALDWLAKCRAERASGTFIAPNNTTFGQWLVDYIKTYVKPVLKPNTLKAYIASAKHCESISGVPLNKLTGLHIQTLLNSIKTPATKKVVHKMISVVIHKAVQLRLIPYNILDGVQAPKYTATRHEVFTPEEIARIKAVLPHYKHGNIVIAALASGCRINELCQLKIQDIHGDSIHIGAAKTSAGVRDIALPPAIITMLRQEYQQSPISEQGYIFHTNSGKHVDCKWIEFTWHNILTKANVPYRSFHYLRHTHATRLLHAGLDIVEVQHRLGHANASVTLNIYGHIEKDCREKIKDLVDKMI